MAVEDIPPRRPRGLGTRLGEILASTPMYRPSAAEALYGPPPVEEAAPIEPISEAPELEEEEEEERRLPDPTDIFEFEPIPEEETKRPDKYSRNWRQGPGLSTRVRAAQWIATEFTASGVAVGDLIVSFDRHNKGASPIYTYHKRFFTDFERLTGARSPGAVIGQAAGHPKGPYGITGAGNYTRGSIPETAYRALHPDFTGEILSEE